MAAWSPPADDAVWTPPSDDAVSADADEPQRAGWAEENLLGPGEVLAGMAANVPHAMVHSGIKLYRKWTGGDVDAPDPDAVNALEVPMGPGGKQLLGDAAATYNKLNPPENPNSMDAQIQGIRSKAMGEQNATVGDVLNQTADTLGDVANVAPGLGVAGKALGAISEAGGLAGIARKLPEAAKAAQKAAEEARAAREVPKPAPAPTPPPPAAAKEVTGESLRAQPNPIPPPEGTVAAAMAAPPVRPAAGEVPPTGRATLPERDDALQDMTLSPEERATVREGVAARRRASDNQDINTDAETPKLAPAPKPVAAAPTPTTPEKIFNSPKEEGPQETPAPEEQAQRQAQLDALHDLSGEGLPNRRASAISGDYNATGNDWQDKETGSKTMQTQIASENAALHSATAKIHNGIGSEFEDSVDPATVSARGRVVRGAIQGIEDHFNNATDSLYNEARATSGDKPLPNFLGRAESFLKDDANYMPEGFRKSALARLNQLKTEGDNGVTGEKPAAPSSVGAAEKFREWVNKSRTLDNMHVTRQLVDHTDLDVAEHGGPGLFEAARAMKRHAYQMLEEPTGIKKLLTPTDSQGINHAIPEHKVMDYIAELPREQHEQLMNVLRSGAHLGGGELAEPSAAAIKEIQAHTVSRLHDAATDDGGKWNARGFYSAASRYGRNAASTFKDRPDIIRDLKTVNDAGNTLHMDKHYPGAVGQGARSTAMGHVVEGVGNAAASAVHHVPVVGRLAGRAIEAGVEGLGGKISETARENAVAKRIVDREGNPLGTKGGGKQRGAVGDLGDERVVPASSASNDTRPLGQRIKGGKERGAIGTDLQREQVKHEEVPHADEGATVHRYTVPGSGGTLNAVERAGLGVTQGKNVNMVDKGKGWGTRTLQRAVDDAHGRGQVWRSDDRVSHGQAGAYSNLKKLGYDVKMKPNDNVQGEYKAHGDHVFEVRPGTNKKPLGQRIPGQTGAFSFQNDNTLSRATTAPRGKQSGIGTFHGKDVERNPRSEYNANKQMAGAPAETAERAEILRRLSGEPLGARIGGGKQRGAVGRDLNKKREPMMDFDHYSNLSTPEATLDPKFYGSGMRGAEARRGGTKTISLYPAGATPEAELANKTKYRVSVPASKMYDMSKDPEGLRANAASYSDAEDAVREAGYAGYHTPTHENPIFRGQGRLFNPTKATRVEEEAPRSEEEGSQLNIGLHQGTKGEKGFRKMSKQEAQAAVESVGAKVTKNTVLTPKAHGVPEPTAVISTDRPLTDHEMNQILAKTKQSAIPQRTGQGDESMHVAPGHEKTAKEQGWDTFNRDYFREHDGRTMTDVEKGLDAPNPYPPHPDATVKDPVRSAFPGIYDDPKEIMKRLGEPKPESPHLKEIFDTTRKDLHDSAVARGDVEPKTPIPGIAPKGAGSAHAQRVKTPENAERIRNIIQAYKDHDLSGYHGMVGWYEMDPMYHSIKKILGGSDDAASRVYHNLNSLTSYASPMSPVGTEIKRGTAAAMMAAEGNFDKFAKYGNLPQDKAPAALKAKNFELGNEGTMAHGAQAPAMGRFLATGQEANAVKTGTYRRSSDAPSRQGNDHQNTVPVGDSHWARGMGLADVRGAADFDGSAQGTEMKVLGEWYHDNVARHPDIDIPSTSAQAVQWAALSKETGVDTPVGAPKLEIWADKIAEAAKREGVTPKVMWERIVKRLAK